MPTYQTAHCWYTPPVSPLHHHSPLQPLTTSTMLIQWFLSWALSFQLLIPRNCRCCSVTFSLLNEGLCLFLVCSGLVKVSFQWGFKPSDLESCPLPLLCQVPHTAHTVPRYTILDFIVLRDALADCLVYLMQVCVCLLDYKFQCPC